MLNYTEGAVKAINEKVNELLIKYDDLTKNPTVDPSVDIMNIAKACGVKDIVCVPSEQIDGNHALFTDGVVKINENDSYAQRMFGLAHEVGHIVFNQITMSVEFKLSRHGTDGDSELSLLTTDVKYEAARQGRRNKSELSYEEQAIEDFFDHFAANLLVPIHRFELWEDKTDKEIAEVFNVEEKCIAKRRQEIDYELPLLMASMQPCPAEYIVDPEIQLDVDAILKELNS